MTRSFLPLTMTAALCSAAVTASAQSAGGAPHKADAMRLTGCIERADQVVGNGSTLRTSVDSQDFVLIKALPASDGADARSANANALRTGTSGESSGATVGKMYRLSSDT